MRMQQVEILVENDWTAILLSGGLGALIGGLATLVGVWFAARKERETRNSELLDDAMGKLIEVSITLTPRLWSKNEGGAEIPEEEISALVWDMTHAIITCRARCKRVAPKLDVLLMELFDMWSNDTSDASAVAAYGELGFLWFADSKALRNGRMTTQEIIAIAQDGSNEAPSFHNRS
ncbi:hypothetical protein G1H11_14220 [Phytoactinopolyspora alkaliphila]|uniref:Uncharacterized protein n=1 Tax=Phytoactinopolyspora alkaliphila TaxID=1783498 RepID=A0A6N9YNA9_9ACTN|nr:hypothetical protein [Phytoactinopolyspora alkaliphila]NED96462.1 hypothetical protein [Phytoactinopolyspora alkaliphila]